MSSDHKEQDVDAAPLVSGFQEAGRGIDKMRTAAEQRHLYALSGEIHVALAENFIPEGQQPLLITMFDERAARIQSPLVADLRRVLHILHAHASGNNSPTLDSTDAADTACILVRRLFTQFVGHFSWKMREQRIAQVNSAAALADLFGMVLVYLPGGSLADSVRQKAHMLERMGRGEEIEAVLDDEIQCDEEASSAA